MEKWYESFKLYTNEYLLFFLLQTFQKYLSYKKDHSDLLYYILRQITLDTLTFKRALQGGPVTTVEVAEKDLLDKVRNLWREYNLCYVLELNY